MNRMLARAATRSIENPQARAGNALLRYPKALLPVPSFVTLGAPQLRRSIEGQCLRHRLRTPDSAPRCLGVPAPPSDAFFGADLLSLDEEQPRPPRPGLRRYSGQSHFPSRDQCSSGRCSPFASNRAFERATSPPARLAASSRLRESLSSSGYAASAAPLSSSVALPKPPSLHSCPWGSG